MNPPLRAAGAPAALLAVLLAVLAVTGCGGTTGGNAVPGATSASPSATTATTTAATTTASTTTPASTEPTAQPSGNDVLGPFGWGPVTLGMEPAAASATGAFVDTPEPAGACAQWDAALAAPIEAAVVSPTIGVAALLARGDAEIHTPEGVRIGSTAQEVHEAYPEFDVANVDAPNGPVIAAPGNPDGQYRLNFDDAGRVSYLTLESVRQDCYA